MLNMNFLKVLNNFIIFKELKKTYSVSCSNNFECNDGANLICPSTTGTCNCPISSSYLFCDCMRITNNESYWNGALCEQSVGFNGTCNDSNSSYMCQTLTQGTICNSSDASGSIYKCQCPFMQYFEVINNKCTYQLSFNQTCTSDNMCIGILELSCLTGVCK